MWSWLQAVPLHRPEPWRYLKQGLMPTRMGISRPPRQPPHPVPTGTVPGLGLSERRVGKRGVGGVHGGPWRALLEH